MPPWVALVERLAARGDPGRVPLPIDEPGHTTVPVLREELLLIMPPGHPLGRTRDPLDPGALVGEEFIVFESGSNTRRALHACSSAAIAPA